MEQIAIPKREKKTKMLMIPVTPEEHETIMNFCKEQNMNMTTAVRWAMKHTFNFNTFK